jgi:hypothetical protein
VGKLHGTIRYTSEEGAILLSCVWVNESAVMLLLLLTPVFLFPFALSDDLGGVVGNADTYVLLEVFDVRWCCIIWSALEETVCKETEKSPAIECVCLVGGIRQCLSDVPSCGTYWQWSLMDCRVFVL